jgi:hypothetical protein
MPSRINELIGMSEWVSDSDSQQCYSPLQGEWPDVVRLLPWSKRGHHFKTSQTMEITKIWSWVPKGAKTKNGCPVEGQQQFTGLAWLRCWIFYQRGYMSTSNLTYDWNQLRRDLVSRNFEGISLYKNGFVNVRYKLILWRLLSYGIWSHVLGKEFPTFQKNQYPPYLGWFPFCFTIQKRVILKKAFEFLFEYKL